MPMPDFRIDPIDDLIDVPRCIEVTDVPPGKIVEIRSETRRADASVWRAAACFRAGPNGVVAVAAEPALSGSYTGISAMGLVWSQVQVAPPDSARKPDPLEAVQPV